MRETNRQTDDLARRNPPNVPVDNFLARHDPLLHLTVMNPDTTGRDRDICLGRRELMLAMASVGIAGPILLRTEAADAAPVRFSAGTVDSIARKLAAAPFKAPDRSLPPAIGNLDYDQYRSIRFNRKKALWVDEKGRFIGDLLMRGWLARDHVEVFEVADGAARPIPYSPGLFDFPKDVPSVEDPSLGFSGVRLLSPINDPKVMDEIAVFQGASYFRSLGQGNLYGISARGLSIGTGGPNEEFPLFRTFWLERPEPGAESVVVHALLDSESVTGAYRMRITPGKTTVFDVTARLYPRRTIQTPGVGAMSSMFFLGAAGWRRFDDFRGAVHDSDGLEIWSGSGERLWRPLSNPSSVQISAFQDRNPKGFGLMQRMRSIDAYNDLEARYERRPSLWVEPVGDWGEGSVQLLEIPTEDETADNIAAFWRPKDEWRKGRPVNIAYRLHWSDESPAPELPARVVATRVGATRIGARVDGRRHFAIDYEGPGLVTRIEGLRVQLRASNGTVSPPRLDPYPVRSGGIERVRVSFDFTPPSSGTAELRAELRRGDAVFGEIWLNRYSS